MAKYNITEKKKKEAAYITALSTALVEEIYEKILLKFVVEKKYRDPSYTAAKMAEEIGFTEKEVLNTNLNEFLYYLQNRQKTAKVK